MGWDLGLGFLGSILSFALADYIDGDLSANSHCLRLQHHQDSQYFKAFVGLVPACFVPDRRPLIWES